MFVAGWDYVIVGTGADVLVPIHRWFVAGILVLVPIGLESQRSPGHTVLVPIGLVGVV